MNKIKLNILSDKANTTGKGIYPQRLCTISEEDYRKIYEIEPKVTYWHRNSNTRFVYVDGTFPIPLGEQNFYLKTVASGRNVLVFSPCFSTKNSEDSIKLSQLIAKLKILQMELGDIPVGVKDTADGIIRLPFHPTPTSVGILTVGSVYQDGNEETICVI